MTFVLHKNRLRNWLYASSHILFVWSIAALLLSPLAAQNSHPIFSKIEFEKGLRFSKLSTPIQDSTGNIWFGSHDGLVCYNGNQFKHYHPNSRKHTIPTKFVLDPIWGRHSKEIVFHNGGEVFLLSFAENKTKKISFELPDLSAKKARIQQLIKDENGNLWLTARAFIQSSKSTVYYLYKSEDFTTFSLINQFSQPRNNYENGFVSIHKKTLYLNHNQSVLKLDNTGKIIQTIPFPVGFPGGHYIDKEGVLWVISQYELRNLGERRYLGNDKQNLSSHAEKINQSGIYYLDPNSGEFVKSPLQNPAVLLACDRLMVDDDKIFAYGNGFSIIDRASSRANNYSKYLENTFPPKQQINGLFKDFSGLYWLSTANQFITIDAPYVVKNPLPKKPELCSDRRCNIRGITEDSQGNLYLSYYWGIHKLNTQTGELTVFDNITEPWGLTFFQNKLYIDNYILDLTTKKKTFLTEGGRRQSGNAIDQNGNIWIGLYKSEFDIYNSQNQTLKKITALRDFPTKGAFFNDFFPQRNGPGMWVVTENHGLYLVEEDKGVLAQYQFDSKSENSLLSRNLHCAAEDSSGNLWIGSSEGLSRLNIENQSFTHFRKEDGLPGPHIYSILFDEETGLWLGTNNGLSFYDFETKQFANFNEKNGLVNTEYNRLATLKSKSGKLYFGGLNGVDAFFPKDLLTSHLNENIPIILTQFNQFDGIENQKTKDGLDNLSQIHLKPQNQYFELQFQLADFRPNANTVYQYKLEGYDNDWSVPSNQNTLRYENTPPGTYNLRIKASKSPTVWNEKEWTIEVVKAQFWYKTNLAFFGFFTLALGGIYLIYLAQMKRRLEKEEARRLIELDALKTKLYTNITHEFRTPLTVIQGMADQMKGDAEAKRLIRRNSKNLLHLVNQMLDMSKIESGKMKLNLIHRNIISYLNYLVESFHSYAETKNIQITFYSEIKEVMMDYDPEKVQHIIANLLSNAIKFTQAKGKIIIHVSESPIGLKSSNLPLLKIKVKDNGIGIKKENLSQVFNRFYQVDDSHTRRGDGTGIGLALAKELVELMGGTISVESEWAEGTEFNILIPIKTEIALDTSEAEELEPLFPQKIGAEAPKILPIKSLVPNPELPLLLLVEDNPDVVSYIKICLEGLYNLEFAYDGQEGIDKAIELIPDIIISDVMMPKKDGFEVTQTLKNDERTSHIPIIILTAKSGIESKLEGLERGADVFLLKPFHKQELVIRLQKLIELRQKMQSRFGSLQIESPLKDANLHLEDAFLRKVKQAVEAQLDNSEFGVSELCQKLGMSQSQLYRKIKALTDKSIAAYIRTIRLQKGYEMLKTTNLTVSEVAYDTGFTDPNYFSKTFSKEFGISPSEFSK